MRVCAGFAVLLCIVLTACPAKAQDSLAEVHKRGELVIATDATYPPFEYKDKNQLRGFDVELGGEIAKELGVRVRWLPLEWTGVLAALETGKCDLVISGVTITAERKQKGYAFSRPYFLSGQAIARRKGDTRIQSLNDLKDKMVSVQTETTGQYALQKIGMTKDHIVRFDQLQDGLLDLRNGKSDATVADEPALRDNIRKGYPELELTGPPFIKENVGVVARKGSLELVAAVNQALDRIMVDGRYAADYERWIGDPVTTGLIAELDAVKDQGTPTPALNRSIKANGKGRAAEEQGGRIRVAFNFGVLKSTLPYLWKGAQLTLWLTLLALVIGIPSGLIVALLRVSHLPLLRQVAMVYVEIVRGTPLLMQIYVIYFVLPALGMSLPPLAAGVAALSLNSAAYIAEIFRAGIESIEVGQMEAARSLGMTYAAAMRWVILPQTLRRVLPPLTNEGASLLKESSLVSVVALSELMRVGKEIATNSGNPTTIYLTVAAIYLAMTLPLTYLVRRLEAKWRIA